MKCLVNLQNVFLHRLDVSNNKNGIEVSVLRLDVIHPVVSGNKYFKLQPIGDYILTNGYKTIVTKGGAYSNHIVATAHFASHFGLKSVGIIRGENPTDLSHTLKDAMDCGMKLVFVYRDKYPNLLPQYFMDGYERPYFVDEGGYGELATLGAKKINQWIPDNITHIITAVGSGSTMAGLIKGAKPHQKVLGIVVLKAGEGFQTQITNLLTEEEKIKKYQLFFNYHFGGYAKGAKQLLPEMNRWYKDFGLPTDFVYTAKMIYALFDLIEKGSFPNESRIVAIHTGGLQGNLSLPTGSLLY